MQEMSLECGSAAGDICLRCDHAELHEPVALSDRVMPLLLWSALFRALGR